MPIPIPIPMPMGPSGGHKFQQQQQQDEGHEGEVKKIYLLQPMAKAYPQPQMKGGGFIAPVQTHIHMQPNQQYQQSHGKRSMSPKEVHSAYEGDEEGSKTQQSSKGHHHSTDSMKILPIVVIPPIAPMPPIQLPPSSSNYQAPRMTLTPQFNNYLVSGSEAGHSTGKRGSNLAGSRVTLLQDQKSFSDYGGNAGLFRDSEASRSRIRSRHLRHRAPPSSETYGQSTRNRVRYYDDYNDDYDYVPASTRVSRRSQYSRGNRLAPRQWRSRTDRNAARDLLDQQALFDDDSSADSSELSESNHSYRPDCCAPDIRLKPRYSNSDTHSAADIYAAANSNSEQREPLSDFSDHRKDPLDEPAANERDQRETRASDLSSVYYETRDSQPDFRPRQSSRWSSRDGQPGRRLYLDEREIFDDDEWHFDSIKSVTHVSPQEAANGTLIINGSTTTNSTLSTTLPPPSVGLKAL